MLFCYYNVMDYLNVIIIFAKVRRICYKECFCARFFREIIVSLRELCMARKVFACI